MLDLLYAEAFQQLLFHKDDDLETIVERVAKWVSKKDLRMLYVNHSRILGKITTTVDGGTIDDLLYTNLRACLLKAVNDKCVKDGDPRRMTYI